VSMGENDCIDFFCGNRSVLPVALTPFLLALEKAAIDENLKTFLPSTIDAGIDQVLGAGDDAGSTQELKIGQEDPPFRITKCELQNSAVASNLRISNCRFTN